MSFNQYTEYSSANINLAAVLLMEGLRFLRSEERIDKPGFFYFVFEKSPECFTIANDFFNHELRVDPLEFTMKRNQLKSLTFGIEPEDEPEENTLGSIVHVPVITPFLYKIDDVVELDMGDGQKMNGIVLDRKQGEDAPNEYKLIGGFGSNWYPENQLTHKN